MVIVSNTLIKGVGIFEKGEKMAFEGKGQIKKGIVVDTSAMMDRPNDILRLKASIFVPLTVIKQLDGLKNSPDPDKSLKARRVSYAIEDGIKAKKVVILTRYDKIDGLASESDNKIVGAAVLLKKLNPDGDIMMLTTDRNMKIAASAYGIGAPNIEESLKRRIPWYLNGRLIAFLFILGVIMAILAFQMEPSENTQGIILVFGILISYASVFLGIWRVNINSMNRRKTSSHGSRDFPDNDNTVAKNLALGITDPGEWIR